MAQLTVRETIEHHISVLTAYLETAPSWDGADRFVTRYVSLVDEFWAEYKDISISFGTTYYWAFSQACGEQEVTTLPFYGEKAWQVRATDIAQKMRTQAFEALYLMTNEAGVPEEYLKAMELEVGS